MADIRETKWSERSPRAAATRFELYLGLFIIWIFLAMNFSDVTARTGFRWVQSLYWAISCLMVVVYGAIVVGMWWVGRRETHGK